jgi:hypothetical protein
MSRTPPTCKGRYGIIEMRSRACRNGVVQQHASFEVDELESTEQRVRAFMHRTLGKQRVTSHLRGRVHAETHGDGRKVAAALFEPTRRRGGARDVTGIQRFGMFQSGRRDLKLPCCRRLEPHPPGKRIEGAEIEVPPVLVRFSAVERGALCCPRTVIEGPHHGHVRRDLCRRIGGSRLEEERDALVRAESLEDPMRD